MQWCYKVDFTNPDLYNVTNPELKWNAMSGCASTNITASMWNASFRIIWGVGVGLLIVLCDLGYGFCIQSFLSAKPFHVTGKLSYCIYIFHFFVITAYMQSLMAQFYLDEFSIAWLFMSIVAVSVSVATIAYLFIEMPFATLWSYVMLSLVGHNNRKLESTNHKNNESETSNKVADSSEKISENNQKVADSNVEVAESTPKIVTNSNKVNDRSKLVAESSTEVHGNPKTSDHTTL